MDDKNQCIQTSKVLKSTSVWIFSLFIILVLSYLRESTFISINAAAKGEAYNYANTTLPSSFKVWVIKDVKQAKVILTLVFSVCFMLSCLAGLYFSFHDNLYLKMAVGIYLISIICCLLLLVLGGFYGSWLTFYDYLRKILSYLNTPLIYLFLSIVAFSNFALKNYD